MRSTPTRKSGASRPFCSQVSANVAVRIHAVYDFLGTTYAQSRRADLAIVRSLADFWGCHRRAYLDVACGTGNYTVALSALGGAWSAVDVSDVMLAQARTKSNAVAWVRVECQPPSLRYCLVRWRGLHSRHPSLRRPRLALRGDSKNPVLRAHRSVHWPARSRCGVTGFVTTSRR